MESDARERHRALAEAVEARASEYHFNRSLRELLPRSSAAALDEFWQRDSPQESSNVETVLAELDDGFLSGLSGISSPRFWGYILTRPVPESHAFDLLTAAAHASPAVGHLSPGPILLERCVLRWFAQEMGLEDFSGLFTTGGCESVLLGLKCARDQVFSRRQGLVGRATVYGSAESHYCLKRAWDVLGGGEEQVRTFDPANLSALRQLLRADRSAGAVPVAILATLGTTNTGSLEPVAELADVAQDEGLWLHVDGAYGGPILMLQEFASWRTAVIRADSFSFDPHKWIGMPLGSGAVYLRPPRAWSDAFSFSTVFTDHQTLESPVVDQCQMGIQGTRQLHGLRIWGAVRLLGFAEIRHRLRRTLELAGVLERCVSSQAELVLLAPRTLTVVVFGLRGLGLEELQTVAQQLAEEGVVFLTVTRVAGDWGLRAALVSHEMNEGEIKSIVRRVAQLARERA